MSDIPIFILSKDRFICLKNLVEFLQKRNYTNITVIDNNSTYQPLLEWYKSEKIDVYFNNIAGHNIDCLDNLAYTHKVDKFLKPLLNNYYVLTDNDTIPIDEIPDNFLENLIEICKKYNKHKVGLGLRLDDIPDHYHEKQKTVDLEKDFWKSFIKDSDICLYDAPIDTTFAVYSPGSIAKWGANCFRTGFPYLVRHVPWYYDYNKLPEDEKFYLARLKGNEGTCYSKRMKYHVESLNTPISFILPTRNTLPYTKLAYSSLRKYNPNQEIIILDDLSSDGTIEWLDTLIKNDNNLIIWKNDPSNFPKTYPDQKFSGHTITYNIGAQLAKGPIISIFHSDMVCSPNYTNNILKHLKPKTIVASTRIEPPIYPSDKAKITKDFGIDIKDFKEKEFLQFVSEKEKEFSNITTKGFFAPWTMYQDEYLDIGGMDIIYAPFPTEDSDFITRLRLMDYNIIQSRDSLCYHFASRSHRPNVAEGKPDTDEFKYLQNRNLKLFFDKWGFYPMNDELSYPIIPGH